MADLVLNTEALGEPHNKLLLQSDRVFYGVRLRCRYAGPDLFCARSRTTEPLCSGNTTGIEATEKALGRCRDD